MKVISNGCIDPYTKNRVYDCEIINDPKIGQPLYYVPCPEQLQGNLGGSYGYSDRFLQDSFDQFFITIAELRKQKLKKIDENIH